VIYQCNLNLGSRGVAQTQRQQLSPPLRGGVAATLIKMSRSFLYGADGVVIQFDRMSVVVDHHPVCAAKDAIAAFS
jgi:hypothetical protein